ncbi:alpha/beta hydrolase [Amycolatopsis thermoflava]|uniref:alpha/beta hydrolase n=1 Tax=Amycolatopsis thermoflava TaxID=84480 RepID=UPI000427799B|nr:alpha/beta hydrolase [Amycolatopsis thermoflava]
MTTTPVVFIHGLWLHASSWQPWADLFAANGYSPLMPGWPGEEPTVEAARANPEAVAGHGIDDVTEHYRGIITGLPTAPVLIGHSFGGLIAQKLLGEGHGRAAVAIDPAQIKGVKPLPFAQLRSAFPVLGNPANKKRAVSLTAKQFRYGFGNAISEEESKRLYEAHTIPSPGRPLFEAAFANFTKNSPAKVNTGNGERGPLLLISGQADHTVPDVVTRAAFKLYGDSTAITELKQFPGRGHSLVLDSGWRAVADSALGWLARQNVQGA